MDTKRIVERLAKGEYGQDPAGMETTKEELVDLLYEDVNPLCETPTQGDGTDQASTLWEWLYEGDYSGSETAESLAAEWDELSRAEG